MSRYVVTGCAGFIGSHLVDALLEAGDEVTGVDVFTDFYPRRRKVENLGGAAGRARFTLVEAQVGELGMDALDGVAGVFHLAAQPGVRTSWGGGFDVYVRDNVLATQRLFELAAAAGVRVVYASSSSIYGEAERHPTPEDVTPRPVSPYGVTKLAGEHLASAYAAGHGLDVICLRFFSVYGPRQRPDMAFCRIVHSLLGGKPFPLVGDGRQVRDFTYVGDVVSAVLLAMRRAPSGAVYNVGGGAPATLAEAIELCENLAGRRIAMRPGGPTAGDPRRTSADTTRIRAELGWRPQVALAAGLALQVEAERAGEAPAMLIPA